MIKIIFHMGTGLNKESESFEVEEYITEEEFNEMLDNWVLEHSNSYWSVE